MRQIDLDFTQPIPVTDEKRDQLITFRTGSKFKDDLTALAHSKGLDVLYPLSFLSTRSKGTSKITKTSFLSKFTATVH